MKKLFILSFLILLACTVSVESNKDFHDKQASHIKYFKDYRTNLCFSKYVSHYDRSESISIANVPCDKVEKFLEN